MNKRVKTLRRALFLAFLIVGLLVAGSTRSASVKATTCEEAYFQYLMADWAYDTARISYFYDDPETCAEECRRKHPYDPINDPFDTAYTQCVSDCPTNRHTALDAADVALFAASGATCTPEEPDAEAQAQSMYSACFVYDYWDYPVESDEHWAVFDQFWACREASHIDEFQ